MKRTSSRNRHRGLNKRKVERALSALAGEKGLAARITAASRLFLGQSYVENPLEGGPHSTELLRSSLDRFDCVTYLETVLALARSRTAAMFFRDLRGLRYKAGKVDWFHRNHYMVDWLERNASIGAVRDLTRGRGTVVKTRELSLVSGLPSERVKFRCFPKRVFRQIKARIRTGDLILFVSTRKRLDVFHAGLLFRQDDRIALRHAARSAGKVVEQDLEDFLKGHRMSGFILARPLCQR